MSERAWPGGWRQIGRPWPATITEVETGPQAVVYVRDGWAWWLAGDFGTPVWPALHLNSLAEEPT